jgi:hypothetical protein
VDQQDAKLRSLLGCSATVENAGRVFTRGFACALLKKCLIGTQRYCSSLLNPEILIYVLYVAPVDWKRYILTK